LRSDEKLVLSGEMEVGDAVGYFKASSLIAEDYRVVLDGGEEFYVLSIVKHYLGDRVHHLEVKLRRIT